MDHRLYFLLFFMPLLSLLKSGIEARVLSSSAFEDNWYTKFQQTTYLSLSLSNIWVKGPEQHPLFPTICAVTSRLLQDSHCYLRIFQASCIRPTQDSAELSFFLESHNFQTGNTSCDDLELILRSLQYILRLSQGNCTVSCDIWWLSVTSPNPYDDLQMTLR